MDLSSGARVGTPEGAEGVILVEKVHDQMHFTYWVGPGPRNHASLTAYPVLLDSGEVRFYSESALTDRTDPSVERTEAQ